MPLRNSLSAPPPPQLRNVMSWLLMEDTHPAPASDAVNTALAQARLDGSIMAACRSHASHFKHLDVQTLNGALAAMHDVDNSATRDAYAAALLDTDFHDFATPPLRSIVTVMRITVRTVRLWGGPAWVWWPCTPLPGCPFPSFTTPPTPPAPRSMRTHVPTACLCPRTQLCCGKM